MLIALGVSGSIAAYKACEIVRGLDRAGVDVQTILTEQGSRFITPLTLETLSRRRPLVGVEDPDADAQIQHIELTRVLNALVVAPATANVLAKIARGVADDLLSTLYISVTAPVLVAPAMNTRMWLHEQTQANVRALADRGVEIIEPGSGWLAEGETGWGRMAEPEEIVERVLRAAARSDQLAGRRVVVTAGPTREAIDPVRFISNRSSGKMGYALASAAARRGAEVVLISGPVALAPPFGVRRVSVESAEQMRVAVQREREGADAVFMVAAVADYVPEAAPEKIKRGGGPLTLKMDEGVDILAELGRDRKERLLVGFAAETERLVEHARAKLARKNLDYIVANDVSGTETGFDVDENEIVVLGRDESVSPPLRGTKSRLGEAILDQVYGGGTS